MNDCLKEFTALAFKYPPDQVAQAAMMQFGNAYCFMHETVTDAVDALRRDLPKLEDHVRSVFPAITDFKHSDAFPPHLKK